MNFDPIADMLTIIRNGVRAKKKEVKIRQVSNLKKEILQILKREGFIEDFQVFEAKNGGEIIVNLKYGPDGQSAITDLERISKPSRRVYVSKDEIPWVKNGLGIAIISTSKGLLTDKEARKLKIGGELLLTVW